MLKLQSSHQGNALVEYGLLFGLVALVSVAGLRMLGTSQAGLVNGVNDQQGTLMNMSQLNFSGSGGSSGGSSGNALNGANTVVGNGGYYKLTIDPRTGTPQLAITNDANGGATNATSIAGDQWNLIGQFQIADTLMGLAEKQSKPEHAAYIRQLAHTAYYMGAAEGEIDALPAFQSADPYGKVNGYYDLQRLMGTISNSLNKPPAGMDPKTRLQVGVLSGEVYNIGQDYVQALRPYIKADTMGLSLPSNQDSSITPTPGQALKLKPGSVQYCQDESCGTPPSKGGPTIEDTFKIETIRQHAQTVMTNHNIASEAVEVTFTNAVTLDQKASAASRVP